MDINDAAVCQTCFALVHEDYYDNHQSWHEDIRDFINSKTRGR